MMTLYGKDDHDQTGWEDLKKYCGSAENDIGDTSDAKYDIESIQRLAATAADDNTGEHFQI